MKEQLFRKVLCSERLPNKRRWHNCFCDDTYPTELGRFWFNGTEFRFKGEYKLLNIQWLEPVENIWHNPDEIPTERDPRFASYSVDILVTDGKGVWVSFYNYKKHCFGLSGRTIVIAWMPFPKPPKPNTK